MPSLTRWSFQVIKLCLTSLLALSVLACTQTTPKPDPTSVRVPPSDSPTAPQKPTASSPDTVLPSSPQITKTAEINPTTPLTESLYAAMARVKKRLTKLRGLEPQYGIQPQAINRQQLTDYIKGQISSEDLEQLELLQDIYLILGLITAEIDLPNLYLNLLAEQVLGLFDPKTDDLFVVTTDRSLTVLQHITLAHEYVHALQQQHFDINMLSHRVEGNHDMEAALAALIEGDASLTESLYAFDQFTPSELQQVGSQNFPSPVLDSAPRVVKELLAFPYSYGYEFVATLFYLGSWKAVDEAFLNVPLSTEQILHPELYLDSHGPEEVTLPDFQDLIDLGWRVLDTNTMGEFFWRIFLEEKLASQLALDAASGWGGDKYALLGHFDGSRALAILTQWDSIEDSNEFSHAIQLYSALQSSSAISLTYLDNGPRVLIVFSDDHKTSEILAGEFLDVS